MIDFTNTHFVDETLLTRYHQDIINFLSDTYLNKSGGTMNGQINSCSILPKSGSYALGSSDYKWQYGYINYIYTSRTYVSDSIRPTGTVTSGVTATNIGATDEFFNTLYVKDIISYGGTIQAASPNGDGSALKIGSSTYPANKIYSTYINIASAGEIKPLTNDNGTIGTSSKYFNTSYIKYMNCQSIFPTINNSSSLLGNSSYTWYSAHIETINVNSVLPTISNSQLPSYLGNSSYYWENAYINNITSGNIIPKTTITYNLGSEIYYWNNAYINSINSKYIECLTRETLNDTDYDSAKLYLDTSNRTCKLMFSTFNGTSVSEVSLTNQNGLSQFDVQGSFVPSATETYDLGGSSYIWNNAYIKNINTQSILPTTTGTYDLGSGSYRWRHIFIDYEINSTDGILITTPSSSGLGYRGKIDVYSTSSNDGLIIAHTNNTGSIGTSSYHWKAGYINTVYGQLNHSQNGSWNGLSTAAVYSPTAITNGVDYLWGVKTKSTNCWNGLGVLNDAFYFTFFNNNLGANEYLNALGIWAYDKNYISLQASGGYMRLLNHIYPNATNTYNLGADSLRWNNIYANKGYATNGWSTSCDEKLKRDIKDVNVLDKLKNLRVKKFKYSQKAIKEKQWNEAEDKKMFSELSKGNRNYKRPETPKFEDDENSPDYIMAMAGEFNKAFGLDGDNEDTINYTNAIGVALRAIQELSEQVDELKRKLNEKNKK